MPYDALASLSPASTDACALSTSIPPLDIFLGPDGIPTKKLTEITGSPGSGRTQITLQLAAQAHLPAALGGLSGDTLYIDARGALCMHQLSDFLTAHFAHLREVVRKSPSTKESEAIADYLDGMKPTVFFEKHFHLYRVSSLAGLLATITALPSLLHVHPNTRLVVINGFPMEAHCIADPLCFTKEVNRPMEFDAFRRTAALCNTIRGVASIAIEHTAAVVLCTNLQHRENIFVPFDAPWTRSIQNRFLLRALEQGKHTLSRIDPVVQEFGEIDVTTESEMEKRRKCFLDAHRSVSFQLYQSEVKDTDEDANAV